MKKKLAKSAVKKPLKVRAGKDNFVVGKIYFIQTVTLYYTGLLIGVNKDEFLLCDAAWIADTGRFADALKSLSFSEVEPFPDGVEVIVGRGALIAAWQITATQRAQK